MNSKLFYIILVLWMITIGCELESVDYTPEPFIEFKNLKVIDTVDLWNQPSRLNIIHFYLIDGDGDIGPMDCRYLGNCFIELFYNDGNSFIKDTTALMDTVFCDNDYTIENVMGWYTMPYAGDLGQDKALKADIFIEREFNTEPQKKFENFFFEITIYDMANNKSNTIHTDTVFIEN